MECTAKATCALTLDVPSRVYDIAARNARRTFVADAFESQMDSTMRAMSSWHARDHTRHPAKTSSTPQQEHPRDEVAHVLSFPISQGRPKARQRYLDQRLEARLELGEVVTYDYSSTPVTQAWYLQGPKVPIRLLVLQAASHRHESLMCQFRIADLVEDVPQYDAVSCAWADLVRGSVHGKPEKGSLEGTEAIYIGENSFLEVSPSLAGALRSLRLSDAPRVIWVEELCIDSSNVPEKSAQNRAIGLIHNRAVRTIVWAGDSSEGNVATTSLISLLASVGCGDPGPAVSPIDLKLRTEPTAWNHVLQLFPPAARDSALKSNDIDFAKSAVFQFGDLVLPWGQAKAVASFLSSETWGAAVGFERSNPWFAHERADSKHKATRLLEGLETVDSVIRSRIERPDRVGSEEPKDDSSPVIPDRDPSGQIRGYGEGLVEYETAREADPTDDGTLTMLSETASNQEDVEGEQAQEETVIQRDTPIEDRTAIEDNKRFEGSTAIEDNKRFEGSTAIEDSTTIEDNTAPDVTIKMPAENPDLIKALMLQTSEPGLRSPMRSFVCIAHANASKSCGDLLYGDYLEGTPGSLRALAMELGGRIICGPALQQIPTNSSGATTQLHSSPGPSFKLGPVSSCGTAPASTLPALPARAPVISPGNPIGNSTTTAAPSKKWLEVCFPSGPDTFALAEINISEDKTDHSVFSEMSEKYYSVRKPAHLLCRFAYRKAIGGGTISFRKDQLAKSTGDPPTVSIMQRSCMPTIYDARDHSYSFDPMPMDEPSIDSRTFNHYFHKPHLCDKSRIWITRLPQLHGASFYWSTERLKKGWGLEIVEERNWMILACVNLIILLLSGGLAAISACVLHDNPTGVAIGTWLTTVQALAATTVFWHFTG
ncbi:uncharacterized protein LTR77_010058 [Saxophila tyrrhenica]|uniref:Heterokaryon incompatibility domain-containing protein n=1 Tax=Saxophila tyrrhenica TaxID=1690608 RepID=A0AAV9P064_9PEZI|nr:hypothetical protein LTR77_010058 [Saxophila tyrrhenica]